MESFLTNAIPWVIGGILLTAQLSMFLLIIPALWVEWAVVLVYGLIHGFDTTGWVIFSVITILVILGSLLDNVLMGAKARGSGASWLSIAVALVGALAGSLLWPPFGGILLALAGIFLVELIRARDWRKALKSTSSMAAGCGWAVVLRFFIGLLVIGAWLLWVLVF